MQTRGKVAPVFRHRRRTAQRHEAEERAGSDERRLQHGLARGDQQIEYDGEMHTAANLYDALKEGYYGKF